MARRVVPKRLVPLLGSRIAGEKGDIASIYLEDGYLVVTFVDEEKEPLRIPMNFYSKAESDAKYVTFAGDEIITGKKTMHKIIADGYLAIPTDSPAASLNPPSGLAYLYAGTGSYAEVPSGGGAANVFPFSIRNGSTYLGEYDVSLQRWDINFASLFSPYALSSDLNSYVNNATYDSTARKIYLKNGSTNIAEIDTIDIFNPANYYMKTDITTLLGNYVTLNTKQEITGEKYFSNALAIPLSAPSSPTAGRSYLYSGSGSYAEEPSGGGGGNVYPLTITKNGSSWLYYDPGEDAVSVNLSVPTKVSDLANDTGFITSSALSGYVNALEQESGNYVIGITKNGGMLSVSRGTLPTKLSDFTDDVILGNYLPIHGTADKALRLSGDTAHTAWGQTFWQNGVPKTISGDISNAGNITGSGLITMPKAKFSSSLIIPHVAPSGTLESGEAYLYAGAGEYAEEPSGGGVADIYDLTIRKNGSLIGTYNLGEQAANVNIPVGWGDLTEDSSHRFLTDTLINTWNAKQPLDADLTAIAALTGSGLLRRNSNNTWSLDTNTYLTDYTIYPLTVKNSGGVTELTYNPKTASGEITLTKAMVGLGNVENTALSTWAGSNNITTLGTITTGVWHGSKIANAYLANSSVTINGKSVSLGGSVSLNLDDIGDGTSRTWDRIVFTDTVQTITGKKTMTNVSVTGYLAVPKIAPASPVTGDIYLWADADGNYSEIPGGGVADIYDLTVRKNGTSLGTYNLGEQAADINITIGWADLTEDSSHKFVSQSEKDTWSAKQNAISDLTTIRGNANKGATAYSWGDHSLAGYATPSDISTAISALGLGTASKKDAVSSITSGGAGLPTAGTVYTYVNNAITAAQPYKGVSSTAITDGGTEMPTISGYTTRTKGDVVAYNKKEFIWEGDKWRELGDEGSYALKTVQVIAGTGLTGGGAISQDVTLSLSSATQASLALANSALQSSDMKALTLKVGSITVANNYDALTARTYTITKANLTDTIGTTTYAPYHADGYLPLSGGTLTGTLYTQHILPSSALGVYNIGSETAPFDSGYFSGSLLAEESVETYDVIAHGTADLSVRLAIPTSAPTSPASGKTYLWASSLGEYAETPSGGGTATIYDLTIRKNGTSLGTVNLGEQAGNINIPVGWSDLTPDASHRFLTDTQIGTWNAKQNAISDLATIRSNASHGNTAYGWGDHSQAGYLKSFTETDPIFSASAASGITSGNITSWNGKYTKPTTGIPKTDLASAVQTSLGLADTALQSVAFSDLTSHPTTIDSYGITDAYISNGSITLGSNSITPLTSFTETDPTVPSWAKATSKPTYTLDEVADGSTRKLANYLPLAGGRMTGAAPISMTYNKVALDFRPDNISYTTSVLYSTIGNEALMLSAANPVTSIILKSGYKLVNDTAWNSQFSDSNKPSLQIKGQSVYVNDFIADGVTPAYNFKVGGSSCFDGSVVFDASTTDRYIYYKASDAVSYRGIMFGTSGDLTIGYDGPANSRSLYLDGFNEYLRFGSTKQYSVKLNSTGTVELSGISAVLPVTTNEVNLGSSAKAFNNIYGKLDLSYLQSASDLKAIEALTGTGLAKRTADNTWELTDTADKAEELATFSEEDAMFTYCQVPSAAQGDVLKATAVKGKSIVWNQLFSKGGSASLLGVTLTHNDDGSYTISGTASASGTIYMLPSSNYIAHDLIGGHIHLIKEERISGSFSGNANSAIRITRSGPVLWFATSSSEKSISTDAGDRYPYIIFNSGDSFTDYRFTLQAFDLTLMFGAGNEPATAAEFEALYPDYHSYNAGELVNNAASGVEMLDAGGNSLGTIPMNITELTSGGVQIFPDGMKSAGTAYDEWSGRRATKRIGAVDLGTLTYTRSSSGLFVVSNFVAKFNAKPNPSNYAPSNLLLPGYRAVGGSPINGSDPEKEVALHTSGILYINTAGQFTDISAFKAAMSGVYLYYELATPVTYTTDQPLPGTLAEFESGGTMRRLPVDTTSEVIAPMVCDFQYGANMSDVAKAYLPLSGGTVTGTLEAAGELIIPDSAPRNPDSTKVYLYCDTTGNYYQS